MTVRTNIEQLIGGATEETIIARVGEGIITAIGSSDSHLQVMENPDRISKAVLDRGLDAQTAFEIVSIDIADIDVGQNIGARLAGRPGRGRHARRPGQGRGAPGAGHRREQEMKAQVARNRAGVVLAEAEVPLAMAAAFREGNLERVAPKGGIRGGAAVDQVTRSRRSWTWGPPPAKTPDPFVPSKEGDMAKRRPKRLVKTTDVTVRLRKALTKRTKGELIDVLVEFAQRDSRDVLRRLESQFDVKSPPGELVAATRQAIAEATDFDERDMNYNFDYDCAAYDQIRRNLARLIDLGQVRPAMELSLELMKDGSYQVEMSDEGLMSDDIKACFGPVLQALEKCDLPPAEVVAWCRRCSSATAWDSSLR